MSALPGLTVRMERPEGVPSVRGEAVEAWFIFCLVLLSFIMWRLTGIGLNDRN